jgi:hypothetical protein
MKALTLVFLSVISFSSYAQSSDEEWGKRYDAIIDDACSHIVGECLVRYSAFPSDEDDLPINNLQDIAIKGRVVIIQKYDSFWGEGKDFKSRVIENPTWLDLTIEANTMIKTTGDSHHRYLEDFGVLYEKNGIRYIELSMGS